MTLRHRLASFPFVVFLAIFCTAQTSHAGVMHAFATAQVPEFGTTPGTVGFSRVDQSGEVSASATTTLTRRGFRTAFASSSLREDRSLRLKISGQGNWDGYGASAGWQDTFRVGKDTEYDQLLLHVGVHATYNQFPGFGIGRSAPGDRTADLSVASVQRNAGVHRAFGNWQNIYEFSATEFRGDAIMPINVVDGEADLSIFFTATESIGGDQTFFDGLNTATLLRITDVNGIEVHGSFASGMVSQSAIQGTVPEPSSFLCMIGALIPAILKRKRRADCVGSRHRSS